MRWEAMRCWVGALAPFLLCACQGEDRPPGIGADCFEGDTRSCQCSLDLSGERTCEDGAWSDCHCGGAPPGGAGGGAGAGAGSGTGGSPSVVDAPTVIELSALVGYHYDASGVRFVTETGVIHLDWDGEEVNRFEAERPLTASGYADGLLVVADSGAITGLDEDLAVLHETNVVESCIAGGMVTGNRFVCGPNEDWQRIFYVYDAETGDLLASSEGHTYEGLPIRVVPGSNQFITTENGYTLFEVGADDVPTYVGDGSTSGFSVLLEFGFLGEPVPTHVVSPEGAMLNFATADCNATDRLCFVRDGNLGTLPGDAARYVSVGTEHAGEVYALIAPSGGSWNGPCRNNCILHRIEIETRSVLATKVVPDHLFFVDTRPQAFYLIPTPDGDSVWLIQSGRSIHQTGYNDSLDCLVSVVPMPAN